MTREVSFTVYGEPASKGSLTAIVRGGKARMIPGGSFANRKGMEAWKRAVEEAGRAAMRSDWDQGLRHALDGPLALEVTFFWSRPKHETRAQKLRTWKTTPCDLDKALRALLDPLKGIVIADDARIVRIVAEKRYVPHPESHYGFTDQRPRAEVRVTALEEGAE